MCGVRKMTHCGIAHGGWRVVVWLVYRWQLARPLFGVRLCSVYLCLVSVLTSQCVCAWCAANDYLSIAQFETVIGLHPTIYIVTWCWEWWGHILTWEGLIAFWNTLRSKWSTFPSQKLLRNFFWKMRQTVWQFFRENVEPFYPRSNSCQHVGTGSNIVQMQIHKHKIDFVYKSDTSGGNKMHQKLTRSFHLPGHWQNDSYIFCILNTFGQKACLLAIHQGVKGKVKTALTICNMFIYIASKGYCPLTHHCWCYVILGILW